MQLSLSITTMFSQTKHVKRALSHIKLLKFNLQKYLSLITFISLTSISHAPRTSNLFFVIYSFEFQRAKMWGRQHTIIVRSEIFQEQVNLRKEPTFKACSWSNGPKKLLNFNKLIKVSQKFSLPFKITNDRGGFIFPLNFIFQGIRRTPAWF